MRATKLGIIPHHSLSPYFTSKPLTAVDYHYDVNGNLTRDLNKDIGSATADGIVYNHLDLPWQITFRSATGTKGTITYIYDAAGNKLKKTTLDSAGNLGDGDDLYRRLSVSGTAGAGRQRNSRGYAAVLRTGGRTGATKDGYLRRPDSKLLASMTTSSNTTSAIPGWCSPMSRRPINILRPPWK